MTIRMFFSLNDDNSVSTMKLLEYNILHIIMLLRISSV